MKAVRSRDSSMCGKPPRLIWLLLLLNAQPVNRRARAKALVWQQSLGGSYIQLVEIDYITRHIMKEQGFAVLGADLPSSPETPLPVPLFLTRENSLSVITASHTTSPMMRGHIL